MKSVWFIVLVLVASGCGTIIWDAEPRSPRTNPKNKMEKVYVDELTATDRAELESLINRLR